MYLIVWIKYERGQVSTVHLLMLGKDFHRKIRQDLSVLNLPPTPTPDDILVFLLHTGFISTLTVMLSQGK